MINHIVNIVESNCFKKRLEIININYSNVKQENLIRNVFLELLNKQFEEETLNLKAFIEHPRNKLAKVDLSIIDESPLKKPYLIEFKFQYTNDFQSFLNYKVWIEKDFQREINDSKTDLFILIIACWDKERKKAFDDKWRITSNLNRYLCSENIWKENVLIHFKDYIDTELIDHAIYIDQPFQTTYNFFILSRTN